MVTVASTAKKRLNRTSFSCLKTRICVPFTVRFRLVVSVVLFLLLMLSVVNTFVVNAAKRVTIMPHDIQYLHLVLVLVCLSIILVFHRLARRIRGERV